MRKDNLFLHMDVVPGGEIQVALSFSPSSAYLCGLPLSHLSPLRHSLFPSSEEGGQSFVV
jgi:hypothetical protein